jgi:hypothetical protein
MMPGLRFKVANGAAAGVIALAGTLGAPRQAYENTIQPTQATVDWEFRADGTVYKREGFTPTYTQDTVGTWWNGGGSPPTASYWIRWTYATTLEDPISFGDAVATWHELGTVKRWFGERRTSTGDEVSNMKVEIATDSTGSNIVATGYYETWCDVDAK